MSVLSHTYVSTVSHTHVSTVPYLCQWPADEQLGEEEKEFEGFAEYKSSLFRVPLPLATRQRGVAPHPPPVQDPGHQGKGGSHAGGRG